jgi:hypothetical protein
LKVLRPLLQGLFSSHLKYLVKNAALPADIKPTSGEAGKARSGGAGKATTGGAGN